LVVFSSFMVLSVRDAYAVKFRFPVIDTERIVFDYVIGCDHDPDPGEYTFQCLSWCDGMAEYPGCTEAGGFPYCYDEHDGTDFMLIDGFAMMDMGSADVVAAADGTVISVEDGRYDRCYADIITQEVTCDGNPIIGNHVKIRHADNMETWYWHFMKNSIDVEVGDEVQCGDFLGKIGSSGYSSGPHLHFEVRIPDGTGETTWIDPYAGLNSQPESLWVLQRDPTTGLPGCYCEGDEIPDFPEPDEDTGPSQDVIVTQDVWEDVATDVTSDAVGDVATDSVDVAQQDVPTSDVQFDADDNGSSWEAWDADIGGDFVSFDLSGETSVNPDVGEDPGIRDMSGGDSASADVIPSVDSGTGNEDGGDRAGGCSSTGSGGGASNGLMLLFAAGILAILVRRRVPTR